MIRSTVFAFLAVFAMAAAAAAQQPPAQQPPPAPAKPAEKPPAAGQPAATPAPPPPPPQEAYTYQPQGRRDPFVNLLGAGTEPRTTGRRGEGPGGMSVNEISVRGILQSRGALVAMITGPDGKTYVVHQGDKLLDGTIKTITPQGLIVIQEVNDPLSLVKQREITKLLRALEVAK
jgi:type IV pilus assembly protein PilP